MKLIDNSFNEIENNLDNLNNTINSINTYIKLNLGEDVLKDVDIDDALIQISNDSEYSIRMHNGNIKTLPMRDSSGAFKTNMIISVDKEKLSITPGIVLRPNFNTHQFIHEYLHVLSSKKDNYLDELGITYTKTGTKIDYYDKNLDDSNYYQKISAEGLNEGITEMLATKIDNKYTGNYAPFVVASELLSYDNDLLLKAYFSHDTKELIDFYNDLESKQNTITREDIINLSSKETNEEVIKKIIKGSIEYGLSNSKNKDEFFNYTSNKLKQLDNSYILDSGSWSELLNLSDKTM